MSGRHVVSKWGIELLSSHHPSRASYAFRRHSMHGSRFLLFLILLCFKRLTRHSLKSQSILHISKQSSQRRNRISIRFWQITPWVISGDMSSLVYLRTSSSSHISDKLQFNLSWVMLTGITFAECLGRGRHLLFHDFLVLFMLWVSSYSLPGKWAS